MEILKVKTENRDGFVHVLLRGELDLSSVAKVQEELRRVEASLLRCSYSSEDLAELEDDLRDFHAKGGWVTA